MTYFVQWDDDKNVSSFDVRPENCEHAIHVPTSVTLQSPKPEFWPSVLDAVASAFPIGKGDRVTYVSRTHGPTVTFVLIDDEGTVESINHLKSE